MKGKQIFNLQLISAMVNLSLFSFSIDSSGSEGGEAMEELMEAVSLPGNGPGENLNG